MNNVQYTTFVRSDSSTNAINTPFNVSICNANTEGYVQKGFMSQLHTRYPKLVEQYIERCHTGHVELGKPVALTNGTHSIIFCPIKEKSSDKPVLSAVKSCLEYIVANHHKWGNVSGMAVHKLGCGENPHHYLAWDVVGPLMFSMLSQMNVPVMIYVAPIDKQYGVVQPKVVELSMETPLGDRAVKAATIPVTVAPATPKTVDPAVLAKQQKALKKPLTKFNRDFYILHALTSQAMIVPEKDWGYIMAGKLELKVPATVDIMDVLGMVFAACQNTEAIDWHKRMNVTPGTSARSLSVGDIIIDDLNQKFFLVTGSGFKQVAMPRQFTTPAKPVTVAKVEKKVDQDFVLFSYLPNERVYEGGEVRTFNCSATLTTVERLHEIEEQFNLHTGDIIQMVASGNAYRLEYNGFKKMVPVTA